MHIGIKYSFEGSVFDACLFILLLLSCISVIYVKRPKTRLLREASDSYVIFWGSCLFLFSLFGFIDPDYYSLGEILQRFQLNHFTAQIEPIYVWIFNICPVYTVFRFIVWGLATVIMIKSIKLYRVSYKTTYFFLTVFYAFAFYKLRGSLGISLLFIGISYLFLQKKKSKDLTNFLLGVGCIIVSFFFHKSMIISLVAMLIAYVTPFNKKNIIISLCLFPILWESVPIIINGIPALKFGTSELGLAVSSAGSYMAQTQREMNLIGLIRYYMTYIPMYWGLIILTKKTIFNGVKLPSSIYYLFKYWYVMFYTASLFFGQDLSTWLYIRFITMALFPMALVMGYYYRHYKVTLGMKILGSLAIISCLLDMYYPIYSRFIK